MTILGVFLDSPASHAGLQPHDSILAVDGTSVMEAYASGTNLLLGPRCSLVVVTVATPGQPARDVSLVRFEVSSPLPIDARLVPGTGKARIGYMFVPTFFDETIPGQVEQALEQLSPLDGLILDDRMNGGGSSRVVEPMLALFTSGTVGHFVSRSAVRALEITAHPVQNSQKVPLVVLIGKDTVSFGEVFAGVLHDIGRARLVGETTLGNVETLHGYNLQDGSQAWIAVERFDPPVSHADWERDGVKPDVEQAAAWEDFTFDSDPAVQAAVKLLTAP